MSILSDATPPPVQRSVAPLSSDPPPEYGSCVDEAIREYNAARFAEARALFARAHAIYPSARTLRGLGMVEFELRNYRESIAYLEQALASPVRALDAPLRGQIQALLGRARRFVGQVRLKVEPLTTATIIDGVPLRGDDPKHLLLTVGDHTLEFRAPGYLAERRTIRVTGGEEITLNVVLTVRLEPADSPMHAPISTERPLYKNPWLWSGVGLAVAGAVAVGIALGTRSPDRASPRVNEEL